MAYSLFPGQALALASGARPRRVLAVLACLLAFTAQVRAQEDLPPAQSFAALEAAGARIGEIRVYAQDIFNTADPRENAWLFRLANKLHLQTRPQVIERQLLFKRGEQVSVRLIEETERLLRSNRYLYDVKFIPKPTADDKVVDIDVVTRDTWSLAAGASASRTGGANASGLQIADYNLLGTGTTVTLGRNRTVDRTSTVFGFANQRLFGSWVDLNLSHANSSDGKRSVVTATRPFYALDARWAAGVSAIQDDRVASIYRGGVVVSQYRQRQDQGEVFMGWSEGLVQGWVHRWSVGATLLDSAYAPVPGLAPPAALPADRRLRAPFVRWEVLEDRFDRELNRNLIGRPEYFSLGWSSAAQVGYAAPGLGSSVSGLLYAATMSRGFEPLPGHTLMASARLSGEYLDRALQRQRTAVQAQYYLQQGPHWLFYAAASAETLTRPDAVESLVLGGEEGLRGYPLRYQAGLRKALVTLEERFYTDWHVWQLFRVGGAAYIDAGRAWGGRHANPTHAGWLANVGLGLRIVNTRSAFSNVLHVDVAAPLNSAAGVKKLQFLVKTRTSF